MKFNNISLDDLLNTNDLFKRRQWKIDDRNKYSLYNRFLSLMDRLNEKEKELLIELMGKIQIVGVEEYKDLLFEVLEKITISKSKEINSTIFVMPIVEEYKENCSLKTVIKSGSFLSYLFKNVHMQYREPLAKNKFDIICGFDELNEKKIRRINNSILLLPDDFIGSGEQAVGMVEKLEQLGINRKHIIVLALFILEEGKRNLRNRKIDSYEHKKLDRAFGNSLVDKRKRELVKSISEKCGIDENQYLGHNNSEALIVLSRTPNNTLYFLHNKGKGQNKNIVPVFPR